jgi:hypothetical protein
MPYLQISNCLNNENNKHVLPFFNILSRSDVEALRLKSSEEVMLVMLLC